MRNKVDITKVVKGIVEKFTGKVFIRDDHDIETDLLMSEAGEMFIDIVRDIEAHYDNDIELNVELIDTVDDLVNSVCEALTEIGEIVFDGEQEMREI